ncbi:uncharacterized protein SPPG_03962 [Spizellomyces punctatus DAOM BR117]|uniref:F-box domain-containing protein n=1 Tax=Spizellomyces punctatus (strain DAOM BR117) TaxID=645134 RepID=A0A0L0HIH7_SPIPD|nr:uncharacterized protein SPPG_03962 [Spizellomyces punctatus DAOM BR117]KND00858.1 hypothetical protein SPPG_03962 [Spizellomyces punctatus DAOM BR117]|eukprot:XP_016608897.1 hypothetical protein SPPG_03962 [Spizellomyces punctatus DAOM BR117]
MFPIKQQNNHYCYRHRPGFQRANDVRKREEMNRRLAALPQKDRNTVSQLWSLFAATQNSLRPLILDGILDHCCLPQLSYMSSALAPLVRIDFVTTAPTEIAIRILQYLDAKSLCHAAQVSKAWKKVADDDIIWHRMCEQHIDKKCKKCGWGLPLLDKKRKAVAMTEGSDKRRRTDEMAGLADCAVEQLSPKEQGGLHCVVHQDVRYHQGNAEPSSRRMYKRPWKEIYAERLVVERNWRRANYTQRELKGHTDSVMALHYDECRSLLVTGSYDYSIRVWNTDTMECIKVLTGHTRCVRGIHVDDSKIISGSMDRTLRIWNLKTFQCIRVLEGHTAGVVCLHFNDKILASGSVDGSIRVWNLGAGCCFTLSGHRDWVNKVQIIDKTRLISCSDDATVKMWNLETRQEIRTFRDHVGQVQGMQAIIPHSPPRLDGISYSGGLLVTGALDNTVRIWCLETGECLKKLFGHVEGVWCIGVDSLRIVSGSQDRKVIVWELEGGKQMYELGGHNGAVNCCQLTDTKIITGGEDGTIRIWDFLPVNLFPSRQLLVE